MLYVFAMLIRRGKYWVVFDYTKRSVLWPVDYTHGIW